jgi:hypothetical protein
MNGALVNYDEGRRRIQIARSHDEVADIRDKAQALTLYARQAKDSDLLAWVSEIKVRAERRAGELIQEQQANGKIHKRQNVKSQPATSKSLAATGITKTESSRWQQMAKIPEAKFERAIAVAKDQIGEVTTAFMLREAASKPKPNGSRSAKAQPAPVGERLDRDGQLARFYVVVRGCEAILDLRLTPEAWLADAPAELRHAIVPAVAPVHKWLSELLEVAR